MDEQGESGEYRFSFTLERRELEESLSYAIERSLIERLPAVQRTAFRNAMLWICIGLLAGLLLFLVRSEAFLWSVMLSVAVLSGFIAFGYLRMAHRGTLLREWKKQYIVMPDEDTMAYLLQPCDVVLRRGGVEIRHPDVHHSYSWRAIQSIEPTTMCIAVRFRNHAVYNIPLRLLDDETNRNRFLETVRV